MKQGIHPDYHTVKVTCTCGNEFDTRSTLRGDALLESICWAAANHTGGQRKDDGDAQVQPTKAERRGRGQVDQPFGQAGGGDGRTVIGQVGVC